MQTQLQLVVNYNRVAETPVPQAHPDHHREFRLRLPSSARNCPGRVGCAGSSCAPMEEMGASGAIQRCAGHLRQRSLGKLDRARRKAPCCRSWKGSRSMILLGNPAGARRHGLRSSLRCLSVSPGGIRRQTETSPFRADARRRSRASSEQYGAAEQQVIGRIGLDQDELCMKEAMGALTRPDHGKGKVVLIREPVDGNRRSAVGSGRRSSGRSRAAWRSSKDPGAQHPNKVRPQPAGWPAARPDNGPSAPTFLVAQSLSRKTGQLPCRRRALSEQNSPRDPRARGGTSHLAQLELDHVTRDR